MTKKRKHIKFPSIEQFRHVQRSIDRSYKYVGKDWKGEDIFDHSIQPPVVTACGTVKLYGTNAGITYDGETFWPQSRSQILSVANDNAGFASFVDLHRDYFEKFFAVQATSRHVQGTDWDYMTVFGEFAGEGIQKGVAITQLAKAFYIFDLCLVKILPDGEPEVDWIPTLIASTDKDLDFMREDEFVRFIWDYPTYKCDIDFARPEEAIANMTQYVKEVEECCPVGKQHGVEGVGEGIVWKFEYKNTLYRFKTKGEKHSKSRVKTLPDVDPSVVSAMREVVERVTPSSRLEQGLSEIFGPEWKPLDLDRKRLADYLRWVVNDIAKEDSDIIEESGFDRSKLNKLISDRARKFFFSAEQGG